MRLSRWDSALKEAEREEDEVLKSIPFKSAKKKLDKFLLIFSF